jgi:hypothetical protein
MKIDSNFILAAAFCIPISIYFFVKGYTDYQIGKYGKEALATVVEVPNSTLSD